MKIIKKLIIASILSLSTTVFAESPYSNENLSNYEDEGDLKFQIRGVYSVTKKKTPNFSTPINEGAKAPERLIGDGFGVEGAINYFVTNNIGAELALGVVMYKVKSSAIKDVFTAYGRSTKIYAIGKNNDLFLIPLTATVQYHIAPFGAIRPYIGVGAHGSFAFTTSKAFKVDPVYGLVGQVGVNLVTKDDSFFTLDVKQYFSKNKITYKSTFLGNSKNTTSKSTLNPLVFSIGFGFKF